MESMAYFAENHLCRLSIWPDALLDASMLTNMKLKHFMWGPHDFTLTGHLKHYERMAQLSACHVKTLITVGQYDFVSPIDCQTYAQCMPQAECAEIQDASHHAHLEQPDLYGTVLQGFLS